MLFMGQLLTVGDVCPQFFTWSTLLVTLVTIMASASPGARIWAGWIVLSLPFFISISTITNNDVGTALFGALMWLSIRETNVKNRWLLAGIMAGIALGIKYSALGAFAGFALAFLIIGSGTPRERIRLFVVICMGLGIGYLPWFLKNTLWTGDPLYPALSHVLPWATDAGRHVTDTYARELTVYGGGMDGVKRWVLGIWRATTEDSRYYESELGMTVWCSIPFFIWGFIRYRSIRLEILSFFFFIALWSAGPQITRFIAATVPVFALATGEICFRLKEIRLWKGMRVVIWLLVLSSTWIAFLTLAQFGNPYAYFLKRLSRTDYLLQYNPTYPAAKWLVENGHAHQKVLLLGVEDLYLFTNPLKYSGPFDRKWIVRQAHEAMTTEDLVARVNKEGIRFLYIDRVQAKALDRKFGYLSWPDKESEKRFISFFNQHTRLVKIDGIGPGARELREILISVE